MQKLSRRLQAVADFVTEGSMVADIGTDHGFLPIYLVERGICPQAVAMDLRTGPLERAQEHIQAAGLENVIQVRLSDGMSGLGQGEADSVVIAGMGGLAVIHILEKAGEKLADMKELVLEPQSDLLKVRRYLRGHRMCIDREELVYEAGKFYSILHVDTEKQMQMPRSQVAGIWSILLDKLKEEARVQELLDTYGACVIASGHPMLKKKLVRDRERARGILDALRNRARTEADEERRRENLAWTEADKKRQKENLAWIEADKERRKEKQDAAAARKQEVEKRLEEIQVLLEVL